jgi:GDPmannose 4,6-dehydratase
MTQVALISGCTGQDGSYLTELLLDKGYEVHGIIRRSSSFNTGRIDHLYKDQHDDNCRLKLHYGDLSDTNSLHRIVDLVKPDEVYNLGSQSHVRVSFDIPEYTFDVVGTGTCRLLETLKGSKARFYQASSSEMFGEVVESPQNENTPFRPQSPYGCAKVASYYLTVNYRKSYGMHASNGILFNHTSERRGETFVTRKITRAATRIKLGLQNKLFLGNLDAKRDWGHAADYCLAMWLMVQQPKPDDYVIAAGETHSVREFCEEVFGLLDLDYKDFVEIDKKYFRPAEVDLLLGDATKAHRLLNWYPKVTFKLLAKIMTDHDLELARREVLLGKHY